MAIRQVTEPILERGEIHDADVLALRRAFYGDGLISQEEASSLFEINDRAEIKTMAWASFFIEALCDFLIFQMEPEGYVDEANARWLIDHIEADGKVETIAELDLLISVMERAQSVPESLSQFALTQVKHVVIEGQGVTRSGLPLAPGRVVAADVAMLRRILYAYGGGGNIAITSAEAEVLFDINDATTGADNDPAWNIFFAQAIANFLMMANGHCPLTREQALHIENWGDEEEPGIGDFMTKMVTQLRTFYGPVGTRNWRKAFSDPTEDELRQRRIAREREALQAERITGQEAQWLANRVGRDGKISDAERAVLIFLKNEATAIDPILLPLLQQVA